jgi:hypothetical protein
MSDKGETWRLDRDTGMHPPRQLVPDTVVGVRNSEPKWRAGSTSASGSSALQRL